MKRTVLIAALVLGLIVVNLQTVDATQYYLTDTISNRSINGGWWDGGPFLIDGQLLTFCLERSESISLPGRYNGTVDTYAIAGGSGSANEGGIVVDGKPYDLLDNETAWLYTQFLSGNNEYQNRFAMQIAIWALEGEILPGSITTANYGYLGSQTVSDADHYLTDASGHGSYVNTDIRVLNLTTTTGNLVQSQLIRVPEPGTLLLLGSGLLGLALAGRRRGK